MSSLGDMPPDLLKKMQEWESRKPENVQVQVLGDIASMVQELITVADGTKSNTDQIKALGAVLDDSRQQLIALNKKEPEKAPDYATPVVQALDKLSREISKIDVKPNVKVAAPIVNVPSPNVSVAPTDVKIDLSKIEKILKADIPRAFEKAISQIPENPEPDQQPILDSLKEIQDWLESIDNASRKQQINTGLTDTQLRATPVPVSGTVTATPTGTQNVDVTANTIGLATSTKQDTIITDLGGVTETAPATDTASSGLNGRLQRIAQRLTSLIALLPGSLGQKARASSLAVTLSTEDVTALTPPAAITGFATSAIQTTQQTSLNTVTTDLDYRFSGGKTAYATTILASGNTNLVTPASGQRIQVYWLSFLPSSDNTAANLVKIGFGTTGGAISTELYRATAMAHWELFTGSANQSLIVNTGTAEAVYITVHYREIT